MVMNGNDIWCIVMYSMYIKSKSFLEVNVLAQVLTEQPELSIDFFPKPSDVIRFKHGKKNTYEHNFSLIKTSTTPWLFAWLNQ